jgi:Protein of unknown function (DUF3828)
MLDPGPETSGTNMTISARGVIMSLALAVAACAQPDPNSPVGIVQKLYAPYLTKDGDTSTVLDNAPKTLSLMEVIDKAKTYGDLLDEPILDFDPIIAAQDGEISNVRVTRQGDKDAAAATVLAQFANAGRQDQVTFEFKREDGAWKIDDIKPGADDLRQLIADALQPQDDPAAMTAPVQAVYDRYGPAPSPARPVPALTKWAPLSSSFAALLQRRQDKIANNEQDPLGFDPVIDGADYRIRDLTLEAADSAVIARFTNGSAAKIIVYDLVQENGAWRIDNIRSPGLWDVRMKLLDAGIQ